MGFLDYLSDGDGSSDFISSSSEPGQSIPVIGGLTGTQRTYLEQWLKTAGRGNLELEYATQEPRMRIHCNCGATYTCPIPEDETNVDWGIQEFVRTHAHITGTYQCRECGDNLARAVYYAYGECPRCRMRQAGRAQANVSSDSVNPIVTVPGVSVGTFTVSPVPTPSPVQNPPLLLSANQRSAFYQVQRDKDGREYIAKDGHRVYLDSPPEPEKPKIEKVPALKQPTGRKFR